SGGYSNFDYRGKDAPSAPSYKLYDPQTDVADLGYNRPAPRKPLNEIVQVGYQPERKIVPGEPIVPPMPDPVAPPGYVTVPGAEPPPPGTTAATRGTVTFIPVQGLDVGVLRVQDAEDLKIVLELIKAIEDQAKGTQPKLDIVYLENADCNYVADT